MFKSLLLPPLVLMSSCVIAQAQHGSHAGASPVAMHAMGATSRGAQGVTYSRSDDALGYSRAMSADWGPGHHNTGYSYAVRLPDGRLVAYTHQLGIDTSGAFFGQGRAMGRGAVRAGGQLLGNGTGFIEAAAGPSPFAPAFTDTFSRSYRPW